MASVRCHLAWVILLACYPRTAPIAELIRPVVGLVDEAERQFLATKLAQIDGEFAPAVGAGLFRDHFVGEALTVAADDEPPIATRVVADVEEQCRFLAGGWRQFLSQYARCVTRDGMCAEDAVSVEVVVEQSDAEFSARTRCEAGEDFGDQ